MITLEPDELMSIIDKAQADHRKYYYFVKTKTRNIFDDVEPHVVLATIEYLEKQGKLKND